MVYASPVTVRLKLQYWTATFIRFYKKGIFPTISIIDLVNCGTQKKKVSRETHSNNEKTDYKYVNKPP